MTRPTLRSALDAERWLVSQAESASDATGQAVRV